MRPEAPVIYPAVLSSVNPSELTPFIHREVRNREVHTPPISTFRWWARRSHALFGALVDAAELVTGRSMVIADPFAGGGTTLLEAMRRGHMVYGQDINPWAVRGMQAMLSLGNLREDLLQESVHQVFRHMEPIIKRAYLSGEIWTTHVFRVATVNCPACGEIVWLYPYALLTLDSRRPEEDTAWFGCRRCGAITRGSRSDGALCSDCGARLSAEDLYLPNREMVCSACGFSTKVSHAMANQKPIYRIVLVERAKDGRRWFDRPSKDDLEAAENWPDAELPKGTIPVGKETTVLLRHGFQKWKDLYPARQRFVMDSLFTAIDGLRASDDLKLVLSVAAAGTAEMAGLSSRWDRFYLKAYETTANHRFAFAPFTVEPNVWGHAVSGRGTFTRRVHQLRKSIRWFAEQTGMATAVSHFGATVVEGPSQTMKLADASVDLVLTDPPYYGDVQYGELSQLFWAWLMDKPRNLTKEVLVGQDKDGHAYARLLSEVLMEVRRVLKSGGRLIMTFHNRSPVAYGALAVALSESGFGLLTWKWVLSENDRDFAKRDKSSCTMDLILECVPGKMIHAVVPDEPARADNLEAHFLWTAGTALAGVCNNGQGSPGEIWARVVNVLANHPFTGEPPR